MGIEHPGPVSTQGEIRRARPHDRLNIHSNVGRALACKAHSKGLENATCHLSEVSACNTRREAQGINPLRSVITLIDCNMPSDFRAAGSRKTQRCREQNARRRHAAQGYFRINWRSS